MIAEELERRIARGTVRQGGYLSSVRALSSEFGCAPLTAHRALKQLVEKGLAVAEPRHGYRVVIPDSAPKSHEVVVFLEDTRGYESYLGDIHETQLSVLRRGALARGWISVALPYDGQPPEVIQRQLREMGGTALILQDVGERFPAELPATLVALGLPTISLDMASSAAGMDQVLRDEAHGATLAAEYLIRKGHRRIGWYGPLRSSINARRRFAGAAEVLFHEGLGVDRQGWREVENATEIAVARDFLKRADRPSAVLALWQSAAQALVRAARECGLQLGQDLELVGWSLEEHFAQTYTAGHPELREACATVTWSMADVGRTVLNRIAERRREPDLPAARVLLPMKLREPTTQARKRQ
jgi:DNA-binding LacI/PurR family transcriptional regulator